MSDPARVRLRVSPGARRDEIGGRHGDAWKVRVSAPPESGRANHALRALLARTLDVRVRDVRLVAGHASRDKVVSLEGLSAAEAERLLGSAAGKGRS